MVHNVTFSVPERELGKSDLEFKIRVNGTKLGTARVSKGNFEWVPKDHIYGYKLPWVKMDELARRYGERSE